jgi:(p)ppGpp synthase/HD superfamily hydrolase
MTVEFQKHLIYLRGLLTGYNYHRALATLEFAREYHNGVRKDGITPEFHHQIQIAQILDPVLIHCVEPEMVLAGVMVHDLIEDYNKEAREGLQNLDRDVFEIACVLDKTQFLDTALYYEELALDERASVIKGADRLHNVMTMAGVFSSEKIRAYIEETLEYTLPMLKAARRNFPQQARVYIYLSQMIKAHIRTVELMVK